MLTFISGWRTADRDKALLTVRNTERCAVFFIDDVSSLPQLLPHAPLIELYRTGSVDFQIDYALDTIVRVNYDTDHDLILRAISHMLLVHVDVQIIVTFNALDTLNRLYPALRTVEAILVADEHFDAPVGDKVLFTRGGCFSWRDYILEQQTALLTDTELIDAGIVTEPDDPEFYMHQPYPKIELFA